MALGNGAEMRNVMALTSKQRAYLGGCASTMDPIFHIGKASLTPEIITALDEALEKRELIKVAVLKNCIDDPREIAAVTAGCEGNWKEDRFIPSGEEKYQVRTAGLIWKMQSAGSDKSI